MGTREAPFDESRLNTVLVLFGSYLKVNIAENYLKFLRLLKGNQS